MAAQPFFPPAPTSELTIIHEHICAPADGVGQVLIRPSPSQPSQEGVSVMADSEGT